MCRLFAIAILLFGAFVVGACVLIVKFVPQPWMTVLLVGLPIGLLLALWLGGKFIFRAGAAWLFGMKSRVLKGATAELHSAKKTPKPAAEESEESDEDGEGDEKSTPDNRNYYLLEVTITPKPSTSQMQFWDIDDLRIVAFDAKPASPWSDKSDDEDDTCEIRKVEVREEGQFIEPEGSKLPGPQTLRLLVALKPEAGKRLKFRYYFEEFGDLKIG